MFCVPNSQALVGPMPSLRKIFSYGLVIASVASMAISIGSVQTALAGNTIYFSGKSRAPNAGNTIRVRRNIVTHGRLAGPKATGRHYRKKNYGYHNSLAYKYQGPRVIDVNKVLARRNVTIRTNGVNALPDNVNPHLTEYGPGQPRIIYFDEKTCLSGQTCTIYLGPNRSSPKIIVVGEKK